MPKLLLFAACEKVLIDQDNNLSLITFLHEVRVPLADNIPANARAQMRWTILTLWEQEASDGDRRFEQQCVLSAPDGAAQVDSLVGFVMTHRIQRNVTNVFGFPIGRAGEYTLILRLDGIEIANYKILVVRQEKPNTP